MSVSVNFKRPDSEDIAYLGLNMRQADTVEVWASDRMTPVEAVQYSVDKSSFVSAAVINGTVIAIFGLVRDNILSDTGVPWLLGTDDIYKHYRVFVRNSRELFEQFTDICPNLVNYVHNENANSIKYLESLGFTICEPEVFGKGEDLFRKFYIGELNV